MAVGAQWFSGAVGFNATGSLTAYQYYVLKHASTAGQVKVASAVTDALIGILQNEPAGGEAASIAVLGVCKAAAEASVSAGSYLTVSSTGRVKATTTDLDYTVGQALEASSSAGDIIQIVVVPGQMSDS